MASKVKEKPIQEETDETPLDEANLPDDQIVEISPESLNLAWEEFANIQKENGKNLAYIMLKEPYKMERLKVTLTLSNEVQRSTFDKLKSELQGHLRDKLNNKRIVLEAEVTEIAREDMIYTNKEKYAHLAKKYPSLKDLQDRLGLDPDY